MIQAVIVFACICHSNVAKDSVFDKVLPTLISGTIVIVLFIIGRIFDDFIKSKEIRRNWYQKVIIDPNFDKLELFYIQILAQTKVSVELMIQTGQEITHNEFVALKAKEMNKIKDIKKAFEIEFINLVKTNFPEIGEELAEHFRSIEDLTTSCIDKNEVKISNYQEVENIINSNKYVVYTILFKPLIYTKPNILRILLREH